jgi:hypothetical protein
LSSAEQEHGFAIKAYLPFHRLMAMSNIDRLLKRDDILFSIQMMAMRKIDGL